MNINRPYKSASELPVLIPVFPLPGVLLFPKEHLFLNIFEPRYLEMIDAAIRSHRLIGMIQPLPDRLQSGQQLKLETVGCVGRIIHFSEMGDARYQVVLSGVMRYRTLNEHFAPIGYRQFQVAYDEFEQDLAVADERPNLDRNSLILAAKQFGRSREIEFDQAAIDRLSSGALVNHLAMKLPFGSVEKQALLEARNLQDRSEALIAIMEWAIERQGRHKARLQ